MQAILYFKLPEDQQDFELASRSLELREALNEFQSWLTAMKMESRLDRKSLQTIEAEFRGILDDHGILLSEYDLIDSEPKKPLKSSQKPSKAHKSTKKRKVAL